MRIQRPAGDPVVTLRVAGEPKPAGSKSAHVMYQKGESGARTPVTKDGRVVTYVMDTSGSKGKKWRKEIARVANQARDGDELLDGPMYVEMTFFVARPQGHFRTGRYAGMLKDTAPAYPVVRPDVLKLARAVEDALTDSLWHDDSRIVCGLNEKVYAMGNEPIGVEVRVWPLPATLAEEVEELLPDPQPSLGLYT